ncbi:MAG: pyridoxine 5'-phosphate synthase [Myxococcales bacterium]|nr:pyridoxine 5'-phosphate synthase [Myxococcales bacterium]
MKLSVNLNKVALLRNSRGHQNPGVRVAAEAVLDAGAYGVTLHWREDNRHTRADDVRALAALCRERGVELNLEGDTRDELVELALELGVSQLTLVPVTPGEITSDHGWDLPRETPALQPIIARAKARGIRTSIFVDADAERIEHVPATGADRVEIYTEPYAAAFGGAQHEREFSRVRDTARAAAKLGIGVNAGHDLDLLNLPLLAREVPEIVEVSIGHAIVCDALYLGLHETITRYVAATRGEAVSAPCTR